MSSISCAHAHANNPHGIGANRRDVPSPCYWAPPAPRCSGTPPSSEPRNPRHVTTSAKLEQELHDIIAHCVSVTMLQAAAARRVLPSDPERAAHALASIESTGAQATAELRRLLGTLRAGDTMNTAAVEDDVEEHGVGLAPWPGPGDLEPLLEGVRAAGVPVCLLVDGEPGRLDPSVELTAYRIVQESLTNVIKHVGRGAQATIELQWSDGVLHLAVTDDGPGQVDPVAVQVCTGQGLPGLRERALAVGGQLCAGPLSGGGFRVAATLPRTLRHHTPAHAARATLGASGADPDPGQVSPGEHARV